MNNKPIFHSLRISDVRNETDDTVSIAFEIPSNLQKDYSYVSGQYLTLKAIVKGEELRRSYSLCSAPHENEWRVAIKRVEHGKFSNYANDTLKIGDSIDVMMPMGSFTMTLDSNQTKNYSFFAAGSGITPVFSMVKNILENEPKSNITLFYGNKGFASIIFREELEALKNQNMERFNLVHVLSRESLGSPLQKGRLDATKLPKLYKAYLSGITVDEVYSCGPEEMIHAVKALMLEKDLAETQIHFELFGTQTPVKAKEIETIKRDELDSEVTVILDGDYTELNLSTNGDNILDAAQKAGADLPFACKGGVCCTCKAKIIEGTAVMDLNYALDPKEVADGFILTCQAHPTSKRLVVSFDE